jgi:hypothetical protein
MKVFDKRLLLRACGSCGKPREGAAEGGTAGVENSRKAVENCLFFHTDPGMSGLSVYF